jgi:hypothetical protein
MVMVNRLLIVAYEWDFAPTRIPKILREKILGVEVNSNPCYVS